MTTESTPKAKSRWASWLSISPALWLSLAVGLGLLVLTLVTWWIYESNPQRIAWSDFFTWKQLIGLTLLGIATCVACYWLVRTWNHDLPARDLELEQAWQSGIDALQLRGQRLSDLPLFLVLGCTDSEQQHRWMRQSGCSFTEEPLPRGKESSLRWYLAEDRAFLMLSQVGCSGVAQSRSHLRTNDSLLHSDSSNPNHIHAGWNASSNSIDFPDERESRNGASPIHATGNSPTGATPSANATATEVQVQANPIANPSQEVATRTLEQLEYAEGLMTHLDSAPSVTMRSATRRPKMVTPLNSIEQVHLQNQLEDVCRRLRAARGTVAPINGILVRVDAQQLLVDPECASILGQATRNDLEQLQYELGIQVPTAVVVDGMHHVSGFDELVRRMGPTRSAQTDLGASFALDQLPTTEAIQQNVQTAMKTLSSWVYSMLRSPSGRSQSGNHRLFHLMVQCRGPLFRSLRIYLAECLRSDHPTTPSKEPFLFSGIFLSGTGSHPLQQGFVASAFRHLWEQHQWLRWTDRRLQRESTMRRITWALQGSIVLLTLGMIVMLLMR
ncbi:MAG: type VI secretion protein IcmF/TssM N-terminal domain-containing protein [Pirellulales bacterium]